VQPPLLLDGQVGEPRAQRLREQPHAVFRHPRALLDAVVDLHSLHSAARRLALQDITNQTFERSYAPFGEPPHAGCPVGFAPVAQHAQAIPTAAHQTDALARNAHAHLQLRTNRDPFDERTQLLDQESIALVLPVEAHLRTEQAGRDTDLQRPDRGLPAIRHSPSVWNRRVVIASRFKAVAD
jgi:hypothetical protein